MKRNLYIFNPENDMALGCGRNSYNAPAWTLQFRHDLELLPAHLATPGSLILVQDAVAAQQRLDSQGLEVEAIDTSVLRALDNVAVMPWGWSMPLCSELIRAGLRASLLPQVQAMETVRNLAHRRTSIAVHKAIANEMGREFSPIPVEIKSVDDVLAWTNQHPGSFIKTPWSGSGRGVYRAIDAGTMQFERWCRGAIGKQGSVLCEVALDKVLDFAMEFRCDAGKCRFVGYSVFNSDAQNQYGGGIVDSMQALHDIIAAQYTAIDEMTEAMTRVVEKIIAPHYDGYLGVDMLLYRNENAEIAVDPCVEVNLRCTMGLVTSILGERHGMRGTFSIVPAAQATHPLTPIYKGTRHAATLTTSVTKNP
ncbi:MAG: hypothetical protein MJZ74_09715 [Muribaculaceae bacterium]|nr:hypothetical protein [Muribaculaceae bacterium]